jgi:uncharacterized protein YndB with AHSA1/START domain
MHELTLDISRTINAPAEKLFNAWLDPAMLSRFMMPGEGMSEAIVENDPREGGKFSIIMQGQENKIPHSGTYLKIDPHSQLVFTWESVHSIDGSTVTLNFVPEGKGTRIDLHQVKFFNEEKRDAHNMGWNVIFNVLEQIAAPVSAG